ncbi:MAG TPA: hypothetical protein VJ378_00130 [Candidatus Paceibacterota bacterium]|nr:hypothetical protein [Candidatus Paceibacterota bacterium]
MSKISIDRNSQIIGSGPVPCQDTKKIEPTQKELTEVYLGCEVGLRHLGKAEKMVEVVRVRFFQPILAHALQLELLIVLVQPSMAKDRKFEARITMSSHDFPDLSFRAIKIAYALATEVKERISSKIEQEEENIEEMKRALDSIRDTVIVI